MINIWISFFGLVLLQTLCFSSLNNNFDVILEYKLILLPIFLYILTFSSMLEYAAIRIFKGGEGEAFSTAILSLGTALLFNSIVESWGTNRNNSKNHED